MTESQRLALRASEIRQRLNQIAGLPDDQMTDEIRSEQDRITSEYANVERDYRSALVTEDAETRNAAGARGDDDAETRALRAVIDRTRLGAYLTAFAEQALPQGAERELLEARGLSVVPGVVPLEALLPAPVETRTELRADAVTPAPSTGNPTNQNAIIGRVFARSATALLGVAMPSVGVGQTSYPVIASGQTPAFVAKDGTKEAAAGSIDANILGPKRLQARIRFRLEDEATTIGLESALRGDLTAGLSDALDKQIVGAGDAEVRGFLATAANGGLPDKAVPSDLVTFQTSVAEVAGAVDGLYAGDEGDLAWVIGTATYTKLAGLFVETMTATDHLRAKLRAFRASANIPAVDSNGQMGIVAKIGAMGMNAVAPIWSTLRLLRDEATAATTGAINVTAVMMTNFKILRAAAYARSHLKVTE